MTSVLSRLGAWARRLTPADVPADVLHLARLQHLAGAGAVRAAATTAWSRALEAPSPCARDAAHLARFGYDDHLVAGRTGLGVLPMAWANLAGASVDELLLATVIGDEIGGRVGLATLIGPRATQADAAVPAAAGAAAAAWLRGLDGDGIARAVAHALATAGRVPVAELVDPAWIGLEAARCARESLDHPGDPALLDEGSPYWGEACARPLPGALGGEGRVWLTRTLVLHRLGGHPWNQVGLGAVDEVLARHVKAADKRLRADQVERVELRVGLMPWALAAVAPDRTMEHLPFLIGALVAHHELTPAALDAPALDARAADIAHVAARVEVVHDWDLSQQAVRVLARQLHPVLGGLSLGDYRAVRAPMKAAGGWPTWNGADLVALLRGRPWETLTALRGPPGSLESARLEEFQWHLPVQLKLYTNRGGWWPERRGVPAGTVAGRDIADVALEKFGDADRAADLLTRRGDARSWVEALRG